jgi:hypothetical protein
VTPSSALYLVGGIVCGDSFFLYSSVKILSFLVSNDGALCHVVLEGVMKKIVPCYHCHRHPFGVL